MLDRLEVIELSSYTEEEKLNIAKLHLLPKEMEANGLTGKTFSITSGAIWKIIREYTEKQACAVWSGSLQNCAAR